MCSSDLNKFGRVFQIYLQADAAARVSPESLATLMVRNNAGAMVPLGTLADIGPASGPSAIGLYNLYPSATVIANPARGYSSGQGMELLTEIADRLSDRLETRVKVDLGKSKGRITVEFASLDDLRRILGIIDPADNQNA